MIEKYIEYLTRYYKDLNRTGYRPYFGEIDIYKALWDMEW
jgi:hypothetical protein